VSKKAPVRKVERFLSEAEITRLAEALDEEAQRSGNPYPCAAIKLLLLTGCRKGEIANLQWDHVDLEREYLRLPDSKTGAKVVYLNAPARALLQELPRMGVRPRVIPSMRADGAAQAIDKVWARVRKAADLTDVRLHDLRHSFTSVGAAGGLSLPSSVPCLATSMRRRRLATRTCPSIRCALPTMRSARGSPRR
jgi:integrase